MLKSKTIENIMAKVQIAAKIPRTIFDRIEYMASQMGQSKTNVITLLLHKGIEKHDENKPTPTPIEAQVNPNSVLGATEGVTRYKQQYEEMKTQYEKLLQDVKTLNHPLVKEIQSEGIKLESPSGSVEVKTLRGLLDNLQKIRISQ